MYISDISPVSRQINYFIFIFSKNNERYKEYIQNVQCEYRYSFYKCKTCEYSKYMHVCLKLMIYNHAQTCLTKF